MKYIIIIFTFILLLNPNTPQAKSKEKWSKALGIMSWQDAKKKCESLEMRLPTLDELKDAFHDKEMVNWQKDSGGNYWSSTNAINQNDNSEMPEYAMIFSGDGYESRENKLQSNTDQSHINARCIQQNFKRKERKSGIIWSEDLGEMELESAIKKCAQLKMKLPTIQQFKTGVKFRELEKWAKGSYWSSDVFNQKPYSFFINQMQNVPYVSEKTDVFFVRCVKK